MNRLDQPPTTTGAPHDQGDHQRVAAVIVAAGQGTRFGAPGKVLLPLCGRPVLAWAIAAFAGSAVDEIVVVAGDHTLEAIESLVLPFMELTSIRVVAGGERRQDSVARGVAAVGPETGLVAIHDGARPLVSLDLIHRTITQARQTGAAVAACPVTDTLKRTRADLTISETVDRESLWSAQTPQVFDRGLLDEAIASPRFRDEAFTDEAALFEAMGHPVTIVASHDPNPKVTHPSDLATIAALMAVLHPMMGLDR